MKGSYPESLSKILDDDDGREALMDAMDKDGEHVIRTSDGDIYIVRDAMKIGFRRKKKAKLARA